MARNSHAFLRAHWCLFECDPNVSFGKSLIVVFAAADLLHISIITRSMFMCFVRNWMSISIELSMQIGWVHHNLFQKENCLCVREKLLKIDQNYRILIIHELDLYTYWLDILDWSIGCLSTIYSNGCVYCMLCVCVWVCADANKLSWKVGKNKKKYMHSSAQSTAWKNRFS